MSKERGSQISDAHDENYFEIHGETWTATTRGFVLTTDIPQHKKRTGDGEQATEFCTDDLAHHHIIFRESHN